MLEELDGPISRFVRSGAVALERAAGSLVGFPIRRVRTGRFTHEVGSDDPKSLVQELGTETVSPDPWGARAIEHAAKAMAEPGV